MREGKPGGCGGGGNIGGWQLARILAIWPVTYNGAETLRRYGQHVRRLYLWRRGEIWR